VPEADHDGREAVPSRTIELVKWFLSDHRRAGWAFCYLLLAFTAVVVTVVFLAPYVGVLGGLVGGGITIGAGALAERCRRRQSPGDQA
jgi:hypothetical protein